MDMTELAHAAGHATEQPESDGPVAPPTLEASGLRQSFVIELLLKHLYLGGELGLGRLAERVCLPAALLTPILKTLRSARLVEPAGVNPGGVASGWRLSATGRARAAEALERCRYAGAAPVTLNDYRDRVRRQAANEEAMPDGALDSVLQGLALDDGICQRLGAALSSTRGLYVFGPPGSGKSALVGRLAMVSRGTVWIPHAVLAGEALIQVFDPSVHRPVGPQTSQVFPSPASWSEPLPALDSRWIACERPTVLAGSRLSSDQFDLQSGTISGASVAPIHLKANNGVLVYVQFADRAVEIIADRGCNGRVSASEWSAVARGIRDAFATGRYLAGAVAGMEVVSVLLARQFPREAGDAKAANELPDRPVLL